MQTTNIKKQISQAIDAFEGVTRALYAGVGILNVIEQEEIKFAAHRAEDEAVQNQIEAARQQLEDFTAQVDAAKAELASAKAELADVKDEHRRFTSDLAHIKKRLGEAA